MYGQYCQIHTAKYWKARKELECYYKWSSEVSISNVNVVVLENNNSEWGRKTSYFDRSENSLRLFSHATIYNCLLKRHSGACVHFILCSCNGGNNLNGLNSLAVVLRATGGCCWTYIITFGNASGCVVVKQPHQ